MTEARHDTGYDQLLEDFGQRLQQAGARPVGRQGGRLAMVGALALAGIVAVALILAGADGGGRLDIAAQARAALAPAGRIVHLVTTSHMEMRGGLHAAIVGREAEANVPRVSERWSASRPTRWRVATIVPSVTAGGTHLERVQLSYGGGTEEVYLQSLNTLAVTTGVSEEGSRASLSSGPLGADPVARIRSMLEAGQLHGVGGGAIDGRAVKRLVGYEPRRLSEGPHPPWRVEYDVDPHTYAPVRFTVEEVGTSLSGNAGTPTLVVDVNTYEALPLNTTTVALLNIHPVRNAVVHRRSR